MNKEFYFISGLPRSGSTLLSAILKQNPNFYADIQSPVNLLVDSTIDILSNSEVNNLIDEEKRKYLLKTIFQSYYNEVNKPIIFDSNRKWTASTHLLKTIFPNTKIICCVRDVVSILDSFERIAAHNSLFTNSLVDPETSSCVETRCSSMMDVLKVGQVIKPLIWLQDGLAANKEMIYLIEYEDLCKKPKQTLELLYKFLNLQYYEHDFDNVYYKNEIFDSSINLKDLHTVRKKVEWVERESILPREIINQYRQAQIGNYS